MLLKFYSLRYSVELKPIQHMLSTVYQISFVSSCLHDLQPRYNYLPFFNWQNAQIFTTSIYDLLIVLNVINCYFRGWVFLGSIFLWFLYNLFFSICQCICISFWLFEINVFLYRNCIQ